MMSNSPALLIGIGLLGVRAIACSDPEKRTAYVTHSDPAENDPAIVALTAAGVFICSGVLISERTVATAAHCVAAQPDTVVTGVDSSSPVESIPVIATAAHPHYDATTLAMDVGVLLLERPTSGVAPVPLWAGVGGAESLDSSVRVVGYGRTGTAGSSGTRRTGTATLGQYDATRLWLRPSPSLACAGDSGGAVLASPRGVEELVGIISAGDASCTSVTRAMRVDVVRDEFLLSAVEGAAGIGDRCHHDDVCSTGLCEQRPDAFSYCTAHCRADVDCPDPLQCVPPEDGESTCAHPFPSPGAIGSSCDSAFDCAGYACTVSRSGTGECTAYCAPSLEGACPLGYVCQPTATGSGHACAYVGEGGCSVGPGNVRNCPSVAIALIVALLLGGRRRFAAFGNTNSPQRKASVSRCEGDSYEHDNESPRVRTWHARCDVKSAG